MIWKQFHKPRVPFCSKGFPRQLFSAEILRTLHRLHECRLHRVRSQWRHELEFLRRHPTDVPTQVDPDDSRLRQRDHNPFPATFIFHTIPRIELLIAHSPTSPVMPLRAAWSAATQSFMPSRSYSSMFWSMASSVRRISGLGATCTSMVATAVRIRAMASAMAVPFCRQPWGLIVARSSLLCAFSMSQRASAMML